MDKHLITISVDGKVYTSLVRTFEQAYDHDWNGTMENIISQAEYDNKE